MRSAGRAHPPSWDWPWYSALESVCGPSSCAWGFDVPGEARFGVGFLGDAFLAAFLAAFFLVGFFLAATLLAAFFLVGFFLAATLLAAFFLVGFFLAATLLAALLRFFVTVFARAVVMVRFFFFAVLFCGTLFFAALFLGVVFFAAFFFAAFFLAVTVPRAVLVWRDGVAEAGLGLLDFPPRAPGSTVRALLFDFAIPFPHDLTTAGKYRIVLCLSQIWGRVSSSPP